ncbi:MAG: SRPBCC family protein [Actinomycetota bacterium]|nr:SRPBCC family protein [Actinomycetota bacterium]
MTEGTFSTLEIDATPEALYAVAADVASYPEWASGVKDVEVLEIDEAGLVDRARFVLDIGIKEIEYVLKYTHDHPKVLSWKSEESKDLKKMEGSYQFAPMNGATEVVYSLTVEPNFSFPGFLRRQAEKTIVTTALRGLRERVG